MASCINAPGVDELWIEPAASASGPKRCYRATLATACARAARRSCDPSDKRHLASRDESVGRKNPSFIRVHPPDPDLQLVTYLVVARRFRQDCVKAGHIQPWATARVG